jgi:hypothetical protein
MDKFNPAKCSDQDFSARLAYFIATSLRYTKLENRSDYYDIYNNLLTDHIHTAMGHRPDQPLY